MNYPDVFDLSRAIAEVIDGNDDDTIAAAIKIALTGLGKDGLLDVIVIKDVPE